MKLLSLFKDLTLHPKNAKELKGLILRLAIQGNLTSNWRAENPNVEPSSILINNIEVEKAQLIKEKIIKKERPLPPIKDEFLADIPNTWAAIRLGEIGDWGAGSTPLRSNSEFYGGDINWFKSGELNHGIMDFPSEEKITEKALAKTSVRLNQPGDVLIAMYGATIGKTGILKVIGTTNQAVCACTPFSCISSDYLHLLLKGLKQTFLDQGEGGAQPNISRVKIRTQIILLPPKAEQKVIEEVVNELFAEVEQLEELTKERISLKEDFVTSALQRLTQAENTTQEWHYLQQHFSSLFTEKKNIKSLRETILQLAVQGKLTAQWRNDNPSLEHASELLKRIEAEKKQLIKEKKIKKEAALPFINDIPFELPNSWSWCHLNSLGIIGSSSRVHQKDWQTEGVPFYRAREIVKLAKFGFVNNDLFISEELFELHKKNGSVPTENDIMITGVGTIGIPYIVKSEDLFYFKDASVLIFKNIFSLDYDYLQLFFNTPYWKEEIHRESMGTTVHTLTISRAKAILTVFPPLEEQKAIVEKVNSLMALCDALEQQIDNSQTQIEQLMQSCLKEVFEQESN